MKAEDKERLLKEAIDAANKAAEVTDEVEDGAEYADRPEEAPEATDAVANADDTSDEGATSDDKSDDDNKAKKSLFGKKEKKDKRDEQIAELNDKLLRNLAEFENFRKRTEREKAQMFEIGAKSIVEKILPTIDNFERGLATVPDTDKETPFVQGMEKIYKQLMTSLEEAGVKPIEAVGTEFDPNLHNAVMHEDNEAFGENTVSEEFQKGYMYRDTVIRHSMVKVAN